MKNLSFISFFLFLFISGDAQNVGIGTVTPEYQLDVVANFGNSVAGKFFVAANEVRAYLAITNQVAGDFDNIIGLDITGLEIGVLGVSNHAGSPSDNIGLYGYSNGWGGLFFNSVSENLVTIGGSTYPIRIQDATNATSAGMVLTAMDANGNATWQNRVLNNLSDVNTSPSTGQVLTYNGAQWVASNLPTVPTDTDWGYHGGSGLTGNIYHTGKVGIGTVSSPEQLAELTIRGANDATDGQNGVFLDIVNDEGNALNTLAGIRFSSYPANTTNPYLAGGIFWQSNGQTFGRGDMIFATGAGYAGQSVSAVNHARMTITNSGDVLLNGSTDLGIGNGLASAASYPIHVNTNNKAYGIYTYNSSASSNRALYARSTSANSSAYGVYGYATGPSTGSKYGIRGYATTTGASAVYGVYANTTSSSTATSRYAGYFAGDVYSSGNYLPSYERLKKNISNATPAMNKLLQLEIKEYSFDTESQPYMDLPKGKQVGMLSNQVKNLYPELVKKTIQPAPSEEEVEEMGIDITKEYEFDAVNYTGLVPHLVKGTQEQQQEIELLKAENEALKIRLLKIESLLNNQNQ